MAFFSHRRYGGSHGQWGSRERSVNSYDKGASTSRLQNAVFEAKNYGIDYVKTKYGSQLNPQVLNHINSALKGPMYAPGKVPKREMTRDPLTGKNRTDTGAADFHGLNTEKGGDMHSNPQPGDADYVPPPSGPPLFHNGTKFNLENDKELAQGHQTPWAYSSSVSSMITGLLQQSQNSSANYWDQFMQDKPGQYYLGGRDSSPWGVDPVHANPGERLPLPKGQPDPGAPPVGTPTRTGTNGGIINTGQGQSGTQFLGPPTPAPTSQRAQELPTNMEGSQFFQVGQQQPDPNQQRFTQINQALNGGSMSSFGFLADAQKPGVSVGGAPTTGAPTGAPTSTGQPAGQMATTANGDFAPDKDPFAPNKLTPGQAPPEYNPWAFGLGGGGVDSGGNAVNQQTGPNQTQMTNATMQSLSLANAYFAPQRMQLAYQLGDMETDMRRLAVNMGRQVDDPILQAKLFKEGMQATRTLDTQQNTFAFQMAEQRRREENQNWQFYSQMAQEEYKVNVAKFQFMEDLTLRGDAFNLNRFQVMKMLNTPQGGAPNGGAAPTAAHAGMPPSMAQGQFGSMAPVAQNPYANMQSTGSGVMGGMITGLMNPYGR